MTKEYARLKKRRQAKRAALKNRRRRIGVRRDVSYMKYALSAPYYGFQKKAMEATRVTLKLGGNVIDSTTIIEKTAATGSSVEQLRTLFYEKWKAREPEFDSALRQQATDNAILKLAEASRAPTASVYVHPAAKMFDRGRQFERDSMSKMNRKRLYADAKAADAKKRELRELLHGCKITIASTEPTT